MGWWKDLCCIKDKVDPDVGGLFANEVVCRVDHGENTSFWNDPWLQRVPLWVSVRRLSELTVEGNVSAAKWRGYDDDDGGWGVDCSWWMILLAWEEDHVGECIFMFDNVIL